MEERELTNDEFYQLLGYKDYEDFILKEIFNPNNKWEFEEEDDNEDSMEESI